MTGTYPTDPAGPNRTSPGYTAPGTGPAGYTPPGAESHGYPPATPTRAGAPVDTGSHSAEHVDGPAPGADHGNAYDAHGNPIDPADRSIGDTISAVFEDLSGLIRGEVALAKAEAKESAQSAGKGAGMLAGAAVGGLLMLTFVSLALAWAIGGMLGSLGWGALVVGLIWGIVAAVLAASGRTALKNMGMPQTQDTAARIPDALKGEETR